MKFFLWVITYMFLAFTATSQTHTTYTLPPADSIKITNCDSVVLILENHTQGVPGFLWNTGRGCAILKRPLTKINDSTYLVGADTLKVGSAKLNSNAWVQGLNAFGTTGKSGTNDKYNVEFYTNHQKWAMLNTLGSFRIRNVNNGTGYKLDVGGTAWIGTAAWIGSLDSYNLMLYTNGTFGPNSNNTAASYLALGNINGVVGVNKTDMGNVPAASVNFGGTSPNRLASITDGSFNPVFVVNGQGVASINGGYDGIGVGGSVGQSSDKQAWNFQINGGHGTGTGTAGNIIFATGNSQASGTTIHSMTNRWWIAGGTGCLANHDTATSMIDVRVTPDYAQFRMRTTYTPTSTSETNGNAGDFSWDGNLLLYQNT